MKLFYNIFDSVEYIVLNHFVCHIPCWYLRRLFYVLFGMKIGTGSRICMGTIILKARGIAIQKRVIVNEYCLLDGRGTLIIEDDVSISLFTKIITGSHNMNSENFEYVSREIHIGHHVWLGVGVTVLSSVESGCVIGAGGVLTKNTEKNYFYAGVPAKKICLRENANSDSFNYELHYTHFFR